MHFQADLSLPGKPANPYKNPLPLVAAKEHPAHGPRDVPLLDLHRGTAWRKLFGVLPPLEIPYASA